MIKIAIRRIWPGGSLIVVSIREKGWGPPRSRLGRVRPTATSKEEQAYNVWTSSNSTWELYW